MPDTTTSRWLTSEEASRRLGIKPATLYSYVSRGMLGSTPAADGRSSRFSLGEVEGLLGRRRSQPIGSGNAVVASRITRLSENGVSYRGAPVAELARTHSFEDVAARLWDVSATHEPWPTRELPMPDLPGAGLADLLRIAIAIAAPLDERRRDHRPGTVAAMARTLIASVVAALPVTTTRVPALVVGERRIAGSIASSLAARLGAPRVDAATVVALNTLLVVLADHEMATSTFAVRIAVSTRVDPAEAVLAGASCGGPLHVGASREVGALFADAAVRGAETAVSDALRGGRLMPGFGHSVYRQDPRFAVLWELVAGSALPERRRALVTEVLEVARARLPVQPNVDFAGAALVHCAQMSADAAEATFLVARMAGWIAHAIEEYAEDPLRFRTRSLYVGETPS